MDTISRDCAVISLFYENAETQIVNDYFVEASITDSVKGAGKRVGDAIRRIIEALKKFFDDFKSRLSSAKASMAINQMKKEPKRVVNKTVKDKELRKRIKKVIDLQAKTVNEMRKCHDQFVADKIDYDTYTKRVDSLMKAFDEAATKLTTSDSFKLVVEGSSTFGEIATAMEGLEKASDDAIEACKKTAIEYEEKLASEADKIDRAVSGMKDKVSSKAAAALKKIGTAKTFLASKISAVAHKTMSIVQKYPVASAVAAFVGAAGAVGAASAIHNAKKNPDMVRAKQQVKEIKKENKARKKEAERREKEFKKKDYFGEDAEYADLLASILGTDTEAFEEQAETSEDLLGEFVQADDYISGFSESAEEDETADGEEYLEDSEEFDAEALLAEFLS